VGNYLERVEGTFEVGNVDPANATPKAPFQSTRTATASPTDSLTRFARSLIPRMLLARDLTSFGTLASARREKINCLRRLLASTAGARWRGVQTAPAP